MSEDNKKRALALKSSNEHQKGVNKNNFPVSGTLTNNKPAVVPACEDNTLAAALGASVPLVSLSVIDTYKGEISLDCDGVTNLAVSTIVALNMDAPLAAGHDFSCCILGMRDALYINSKKLLSKPYVFNMKLENMEVGKLLGKGIYGQVWSTMFKGRPAALKQIDPRKVKAARVYKERDVLLHLKNQYICEIIGAWYQGHFFLLLEQCIGNLVAFRKKFTERQNFFLCIDLLNGLDFIHSKNIVHCNICPHNCLVKHGIKLCIGGFGSAQILPKNAEVVNAKMNLGSIGYQEAVTNKYYIYSKYSDVFSAACVIFELTTQNYLLRYASAANATAKDYITAFERGRRSFVSQTSDIHDAKFFREKLTDRVKKSKLGHTLSRMIMLPWSQRISPHVAMLQDDFTSIQSEYERQLDDDDDVFKQPSVWVDDTMSFVPPTCARTDAEMGLDVMGLACIYYDSDDKDARRRIRPIYVQAADSDDGSDNEYNKTIPRSGVLSKDLGRDDNHDNLEERENRNHDTGLDNDQQEQLNAHAPANELVGASTGVVSLQNVEVVVNEALARAMKEVLPATMREFFATEISALKERSKGFPTEAFKKKSPRSNGENSAENASDDEEETKKNKDEEEKDQEDQERDELEKEDEDQDNSSCENERGEGWHTSCPTIATAQRDKEGVWEFVKPRRQVQNPSKPHFGKQPALDGGRPTKLIGKHVDATDDRSSVNTSTSKHNKSSKKKENRAKLNSGDCKNKAAFSKSSNKIAKGGRFSRGDVHNNRQTGLSNIVRKPVPASGAMISGLQKRPHPPSVSSIISKKARSKEVGVNKVVYTHGCTYCAGKFTSKQVAAEHQRVCKVRLERKKIL